MFVDRDPEPLATDAFVHVRNYPAASQEITAGRRFARLPVKGEYFAFRASAKVEEVICKVDHVLLVTFQAEYCAEIFATYVDWDEYKSLRDRGWLEA